MTGTKTYIAIPRDKRVCSGCRKLGIMSTGAYVCALCCSNSFESYRATDFVAKKGKPFFPTRFEYDEIPSDCPRLDKHQTLDTLRKL